MTKVLFVLHKRPDSIPGGTELHTLDLIKGLLTEGFYIYLLFPDTKGLVLTDYNKIVKETTYNTDTLKPEDLRNESAEWVLKKIIEKFSIDIIHFQHLFGLPVYFIEVAKHYGCKIIISFHDYFYWCLNYNLLNFNQDSVFFCYYEKDYDKCFKCLNYFDYKVLYAYIKERRKSIKHIFKNVDAFVYPSIYAKNTFLALYSNLESRKCHVIEHGIKKNSYVSSMDCKRNSVDNHLNIAFLGNFTLEKGMYFFREMANQFLDDERFHFYIIGNVVRSLTFKETKNMRFLGGYNRELIGEILQENAIDIITLLSPWPEVYSYTLSEAVCNHIPVIATDLGALRERVSRYMVGYLVPYENPVPRIVKILRDIINNPEILNYFKRRCLIASKDIPDLDSMIAKYVEIYRQINK